jgi:hypothetical protein
VINNYDVFCRYTVFFLSGNFFVLLDSDPARLLGYGMQQTLHFNDTFKMVCRRRLSSQESTIYVEPIISTAGSRLGPHDGAVLASAAECSPDAYTTPLLRLVGSLHALGGPGSSHTSLLFYYAQCTSFYWKFLHSHRIPI